MKDLHLEGQESSENFTGTGSGRFFKARGKFKRGDANT